jgi:hypothetical protein
VGASFDAYSALSKILGGAAKDVFIVDPYLDETVLVEFGRTASEGVLLRLLADEAHVKSSLEPAARKWIEQYAAMRPISVRLSPARTLHDRAIFIDGVTAWTLTQSLKDFAKRAPAELVRVDDIASLKIASYQMLWERAQVLVQ